MSIPFIDLAAQQARIKDKIDRRIADVLAHGRYIHGPEVNEFEQALSNFENTHDLDLKTIGCANGTDALVLSLRALEISAGDAVFCPSFTYTATAEAIALVGAVPFFVDVDRRSYNLDAASLEEAIAHVQRQGNLKPKAVIAVDLFGQPANYPAIKTVCDKYNMALISDCAQGLGCRLNGQSPLVWADCLTTSFFPAKPLGCYGDGGAVIVKDKALEDKLRSLAFHGRGSAPYDHEAIGLNSRLDSLQAGILLEKLAIFEDELAARDRAAQYYTKQLEGHVLSVPYLIDGARCSWAQYCIEVPDRDGFMSRVKVRGVPLAAYYPLPTHMQTAYRSYPVAPDGLPNTMAARGTIVALPMHGYLTDDTQNIIIDVIQSELK